MTETEWLECDDSEAMLEFIRPKATKRKLRLFAAACFRRLTHLLSDDRQQTAIEMLEDSPDATEFQTGVVARARVAMHSSTDDSHFVGLMLYREFMSSMTAHHATFAARGLAEPREEPREQCRLLRCIVGPLPFRAATIDPACRTSPVIALAQEIYEEKTFERLPILADALEDADCKDAEILDHCRSPGPHVRGCWVVDVLLENH